MLCVSWITLKMYGRASHLLSQVDLGAFHIVSSRQDSWHVLLADINLGLRKGVERLGRMLGWKGAV